ncbi:bifunctional indole-3-glycerol-phosphate synthase TrpC/phosphoribosylanthranilate isomerase TrpF [Buchnera aphidicola (Neophyllaphis podocarpi)]|uniref:bifunctional indole-3-glycerol-phosphate synthase TrpC/phosphoribosylanthranilate isomerase TrpF n=1 Tax=Buchnera aphidicola TaxID=9 RepID=UPI0031B8B36C
MQKTILENIIFNKLDWIKKQKIRMPLNNFKNKIIYSKRKFKKALIKDKPAFILEIKKHSPSKGLLRKNFDIIRIAKTYEKYASVISVVTDTEYFKGNFSYLNKVSSLTTKPILCKDFIIDEYQIYLASYFKADAILLMLSILNDNQYLFLRKIAYNLNIEVLTEISNNEELKRAIKLKSNIIGINNRNLHDLSIDLDRTRKLSKLIEDKNIVIISESGINKYSQVRELSSMVHGFLIGSHLMRQDDLYTAIRKLIMGENKVCGLKYKEDAIMCYNYGAIYGGLIFAENSIRKIKVKEALLITEYNNLKYVGVFCNQDINLIKYLSEKFNLYAIQLHGNENQEYIFKLRKIISKKVYLWKAFGIKDEIPTFNLKHIDLNVFDNIKGGSGKSFDWSLLKDIEIKKIILAGGLNINNCVKASKLGFLGLDFNSGVESKIGKKDHKKVKDVFDSLRYYF